MILERRNWPSFSIRIIFFQDSAPPQQQLQSNKKSKQKSKQQTEKQESHTTPTNQTTNTGSKTKKEEKPAKATKETVERKNHDLSTKVTNHWSSYFKSQFFIVYISLSIIGVGLLGGS